MSTPSMIIFPPEASRTLSKERIIVDFPEPVLPTTPIYLILYTSIAETKDANLLSWCDVD